MDWIKLHFNNYRKREPWGFLWRISLEPFLIYLPFLAIIYAVILIFDIPEEYFSEEQELSYFVIIVLAPVIETLLFQSLPIFISRKLSASFKVQILSSTTAFFILHLLANGFVNGVLAGLIGGFYLAFTYAHWRIKSRWAAFWITSSSHAFHNFILITPDLIPDFIEMLIEVYT